MVPTIKYIWLYKKNNIYIPLTYGLLSSKSEEIYSEYFTQLIGNIKLFNKNFSFYNIKIMADFEIGMRTALKKCFEGGIL